MQTAVSPVCRPPFCVPAFPSAAASGSQLGRSWRLWRACTRTPPGEADRHTAPFRPAIPPHEPFGIRLRNLGGGRFSGTYGGPGRWHTPCWVPAHESAFSDSRTQPGDHSMKLTHIIFVALAVLLPTSWTFAKAEDAPAPADAKKKKKAKKTKKTTEEKTETK